MEKTITQIIVFGRRWFQKSYGNTYHSATVQVIYSDGSDESFNTGKHYGYGDTYLQTATELLESKGLIPVVGGLLWSYCRDRGIRLTYNASDVARERDL